MSLIDLVLRISERAYQDFYPTYLKLEFVENTSMYLKNFGKKIHKKKIHYQISSRHIYRKYTKQIPNQKIIGRLDTS